MLVGLRQRHIPALIKFKDDIKIEAICDSDIKKSQSIAKKFKIPLAIEDIDKLFSLPLDAVCICTPPMTHAYLIEKALQNNKHVIVEKPMVLSEEEGERLNKLATDKGLVLITSHNFLFSQSMLKAKKVISENKLGQILGTGGIQWSSWKRPLPNWIDKLKGGLFFDEAPHLVYLTSYFLGNLEVANVYHNQKTINGQVLERYEIMLRGENGNGHLSIWFGVAISEWFFYIHGTKGTIILDIFRDICYFFPKEIIRTPQYLINTLFQFSKNGLFRMFKWGVERVILRKKNLFGTDKVVEEFIKSIRNNEKPLFYLQQGHKIIGIINKIINFYEGDK